jgi:membrane associated rhomboid family serine protease
LKNHKFFSSSVWYLILAFFGLWFSGLGAHFPKGSLKIFVLVICLFLGLYLTGFALVRLYENLRKINYRAEVSEFLRFAIPVVREHAGILTGTCMAFVAIYAFQLNRDPSGNWISEWAFGRSQIASGEYWRLLTGTLAHNDFGHLFWNLFYFWIFGTIVHFIFGRREFLFIVLFSILTDILFSLMFSPSPETSVGVSGVVCGLQGAYICSYRRSRHQQIPRHKFIFYFFSLTFLSGLIYEFTHVDLHVAKYSHLGGFVGGALAALSLSYIKLKWRHFSWALLSFAGAFGILVFIYFQSGLFESETRFLRISKEVKPIKAFVNEDYEGFLARHVGIENDHLKFLDKPEIELAEVKEKIHSLKPTSEQSDAIRVYWEALNDEILLLDVAISNKRRLSKAEFLATSEKSLEAKDRYYAQFPEGYFTPVK